MWRVHIYVSGVEDIDAQRLPIQAFFESPQVCVSGKGSGITWNASNKQ